MNRLKKILLLSLWPLLLFGQNGNLQGKVLQAYTAQPVAKVEIKLIPGNRLAVTDSSGFFSFDSLAAGEYTVIFTRLGYLQHVVPHIKIPADSLVQLNVRLERIPPPVRDPLPPLRKSSKK